MKEEVKEEVKTSFDIELSKFDPTAKLKIIKEIRGLLGLGLKEVLIINARPKKQ